MDGPGRDGDHQPLLLDSASARSRRSSGGGSSQSLESFRGVSHRSIRSISKGSSITRTSDEDGTLSPPPLSSPSVASSLGLSNRVLSPPQREHSPSTLQDEEELGVAQASRHALARRLNHLAQRLIDGGDVDDVTLGSQIDRMERALIQSHLPEKPLRQRHMGGDVRTRSAQASLLGSSPPSSLSRSRFSELSLSLLGEPEPETETQQGPPARGMTAQQAKKVIAEATKLNEELATVVNNLSAREEESDHIHSLLIERAERAAQRIIFLQSRISYLESELRENDEELQHLRICLKAVEVQMPPHPDKELQRCITTFKDDYQELKRKRAGRTSIVSFGSFDSSHVDGSPTR